MIAGACGDSATEARTGPADAGGPTGFTVLAIEPRSSPALAVAIRAALVTIDGADGAHAEATAGADGRATFPSDVARGTFSVTIVERDHQVTTWAELNADRLAENRARYSAARPDLARDFTAAAEPIDPSDGTVALTGTLRNARAPTVNLSPVGRGRNYQGGGPGYAARIAPGAPASLVSLEWSTPANPTISPRGIEQKIARWARLDVGAVNADTSVDVDLDALPTLAPDPVHVRVVIPGGDAGPLGGDSQGSWVATTAESGLRALVGSTTLGDATADKTSFDLRGELVHVDGVTLVTRASVSRAEVVSSRLSIGAPATDGVIEGLLLPPALPLGARVDGDVPLDGIAEGATARLTLEDGLGIVRRVVFAPPGTKSVRFVKLPAAASVVLQNAAVGRLAAVADFEPRLLSFTRVATNRRFSFAK